MTLFVWFFVLPDSVREPALFTNAERGAYGKSGTFLIGPKAHYAALRPELHANSIELERGEQKLEPDCGRHSGVVVTSDICSAGAHVAREAATFKLSAASLVPPEQHGDRELMTLTAPAFHEHF